MPPTAALASKAEPAKEDEQGSRRRDDRGMAGDTVRPAVGAETADPGPEDQTAGQRDPGARRMNDGRASEVDEVAIGEKGRGAGVQNISPGPMGEDRIDQRADDHRGDHIDRQAQPLGRRPRQDGCRRSAEHHLEGEEGDAGRIEIG